MEAFIKIKNPDDVECSVTITMKLGTWKKLHSQLENQSPSWQLSKIIYDLIEKAEAVVTSEKKIDF